MKKWNVKTHRYEPYIIPAEWKPVLYADDMSKIVNCASCGKELAYGMTYCSRQIHSDMGFGYGVCADCYKRELAEEDNG